MKVAFCSSEVFPFAKTGGLGDVSGALPSALAKHGCRVKVFTPLYKGIRPQKINERWGYSRHEGVEIYFVRNDAYFKRNGLYGTVKGDYADNAERFAFFCREAVAIIRELDFAPDIIHCNDWQSALALAYAKTLYAYERNFAKTKSVFTIHNLAYQGIFEKEKFPALKLPAQYFDMKYVEFYDQINLMKTGIVFSDAVNTVSPTYAKQIQMPEYGCGLEGVLKAKRRSLCGILNGIDYTVWDPAADRFIYKKYSPKNPSGKAENKRRLQKDTGLKVNKNAFLLSMVSRIVEQKGLDILSEALDYLLKKCQVVILGLGDEKYRALLKKKVKKFKGNLSLNWQFDETMAHRCYAGSDAFLMPSRFEPCGLSQMVSYRYATVPIAHITGGLADTVIDVKRGGGGFTFDEYSSTALIVAVERAQEWFDNKKAWLPLLKRITGFNYSWDTAALRYVELYRSLLK